MTMLHGHQIAGSLTWIAPQARFESSSSSAAAPAVTLIDHVAMVRPSFAMFDYSKDLKFGIAVVSLLRPAHRPIRRAPAAVGVARYH